MAMKGRRISTKTVWGIVGASTFFAVGLGGGTFFSYYVFVTEEKARSS
jgi:hypothetical protein